MKKLSLSNLSKTNLSKMQEQAIIGGTSDVCICAALCTNCSCTKDISAENANEEGMDSKVESNTEDRVAEDIM